MKKLKFRYFLLIVTVAFAGLSCKKQLDVKNPNQPTLENAKTESGIISLASGAVYTNGFNGVDLSSLNVLGNSYFFVVIGYHELMGDIISAEASNQNINVLNLPDYVILDDGTKITNTSPSKTVMRISNSRDKRSANAFYYEWSYMYSLNNACNNVLDLVDGITFSGDAASKKNTIKAWSYFWKGFAYSRLGSMYYSGVVNNKTGALNSKYLLHDSIIAEANRNLDQASALLNSITNVSDYQAVLGKLLPNFVQAGNGGVLTQAMWLRNISTMKARNLLVNKKTSTMTASDWAQVLSMSQSGIQQKDFIFTARTATTKGFFSSNSGSAAASTTGNPNSKTFKVSERLVQDYNAGDKRFLNNFKKQQYLNQVGGFTFSTRWALVDGGNGLAGVQVISSLTPGQYELAIAGSYEENELMIAESKINTGDIEGGLASIDNVRKYQGAGLAPVAGTGLTKAQAFEELRKERRVSLAFRGMSFYDARRWGVTDDVSKGGGRKGAVVLTSTGVLNTNSTINYDFLDYWDVPADETELNPPAAGSAPVKYPG